MTLWIFFRTCFLLACALVGVAQADEQVWVVDSGAMSERQQAVTLRQEVLAVAPEARVLRVARSETGWSWKVRADGLVELGAAREVGSMMAQHAGTADLFVQEGEALRAVEKIVPDGSLQVVVPVEAELSTAASSSVVEATEVEPLLARVRRAHGAGTDIEERLEEAKAVHFRYQREVPKGEANLVVWHDYYRLDTWRRLEVRVLEGEGVSSLTVVRPETGAWIKVGDAAPEKFTPGRSLEAVAAFSPGQALGRALHFGQIAGNGVVTRTPEGFLDLVLDANGSEAGRVTLRVEPAQHRIESLFWTVDSDTLHWAYSDYREIEGGGIVPYAATLSKNGEVVERISVLALDIKNGLSASLFDPSKAFD